MFLKKRKVNGTLYWSLAETYREEGKVKQRIIMNLGNTKKAIEALKQRPELNTFLNQLLLQTESQKPKHIELNTILLGDCLKRLKDLPDNSVHTCVTSPPYWGLRDYGVEEQIGLEVTPEEYVRKLVLVFREVRRILREDGTLWLNLGDSYAAGGRGGGGSFSDERRAWKEESKVRGWRSAPPGLKNKDLVGIPWMVAFALRDDGWYLRMDNIWHKPNCMPESVKDRPTRAHEYIFLLSKSDRYYYDYESIKEPAVNGDYIVRGSKGVMGNKNSGIREPKKRYIGSITRRNKRSVWTVTTKPLRESHFATFPEDLVEPCVIAGCPVGGIVLDPFFGSGTTGIVSLKNNRNFIGIEVNPEYVELAKSRISQVQLTLDLRLG